MPSFVQDRAVADRQSSGMHPLSRLVAADIALLRQFVAGDDLVRFYLALAEAEAARGEDASLVMLGRARRGAALGARFDGIAVFSTVGELDDADLSALLDWPGRLELHLTDLHHARLGRLSAQGLGPAGEVAMIGHFPTVPEVRGRGLARRLALHLRWHFAQSGVTRLVLATT